MNVQQDYEWDGRVCILETTGRLFGSEARDQIWAAFGGRSIYVPLRPRPDHPICRAVGLEMATAIASELGGTIVELPNSPLSGTRYRKDVVLADALAGKPAHVSAAFLRVTERSIYSLRSSLRAEGGLPPRGSPAPPCATTEEDT
jgi:hypothetical protein